MRLSPKFLLLLAAAVFSVNAQRAPYDPANPVVAPSYSTSAAGAKITWFHDAAYTIPAYGPLPSQTVYGTLSTPACATPYGALANGVLSTIDPTHIAFSANRSILPVHAIQGLQPMPGDFVFFTRADGLPLQSSHWIGDGSGYAEDAGKFDRIIQGDPYLGTGWYQAAAPIGSTCYTAYLGTSYKGNPGATSYGGSPVGAGWTAGFDCHPLFPFEGIEFGPTTQASILDGTEPIDQMKVTTYPSFNGPYPDITFHFNELREGGNFVNPAANCSVSGTGTNIDVPSPPYANCKTGGSNPFYQAVGGIDSHEFLMNPVTYRTWDLYNDFRFGALTHCQTGPYTCNLQSGRSLNWSDYTEPVSATGLAGLPENQLELTVEDLAKAAVDPIAYPIAHSLPLIEPTYSTGHGLAGNVYELWPSEYFAQAPVSYNQFPALMGERKILSAARVSVDGGLYSVSPVNFGSGYAPGQVVVGTVTGCQAIGSAHPAQVNAFIGPSGSVIVNSSQPYIWIVNTGIHCLTPSVAFTPPVSGATITATLTVWPAFAAAEQNMIIALFNEFSQYGAIVDDKTGGSNEVLRTESALNSPIFARYRAPVAAALPAHGQGFANPFLWDWVDESGLTPSGNGWPVMLNYPSGSWMTDATNATEGASVQNQNVIKLTMPNGVVSYSPVPVIGTAVNFTIPNLSNQLNIVAGITFNLAPYAHVIGDPTNAGVTFYWITDPCPGRDSLTLAGEYTSCSTVGVVPLTGQMQVTSVFNPLAFTYVWLTVLPAFDSAGKLSIDFVGSGGCVNGSSFAAGIHCPGPGTTWTADCPGCLYMSSWSGTRVDYPHWPWTPWGHTPSAPLATAGESAIYQSYEYSQPDITMSVVVPNGNYWVRDMAGLPNIGNSNLIGSSLVNDVFYYNSSVYTAQGYPQYWSYCVFCQTNYQVQQPVDVMIPAHVTNNILQIGIYGSSDPKWLGWDRTAHGGNPIYNYLAGMQVIEDTTTTPHWIIGSYVPGAPGGVVYSSSTGTINGIGDNFTIPVSNGTAYSPLGAPVPGILQLYIRDVFTGLGSGSTLSTDAIWSIVRGPGTVSSAGLFTAPTTLPASNDCSIVQAQSASQPAVKATQSICFVPATGGSSIAVR